MREAPGICPVCSMVNPALAPFRTDTPLHVAPLNICSLK